MKHYGLDEKKPKASKKLIKRIKTDYNQFIAQIEQAIESDIIHDATTTTVSKREKFVVGYRVTKKQSIKAGRSLGRSTGAIKKSGANKRSGGGKEHGECLGASSRINYKFTPIHQVENTEYKKTKMGDSMNTQLNHIIEGYTALLELIE